jgi:protein-S-isoprenylcysteine O-methyltransferase Ste14
MIGAVLAGAGAMDNPIAIAYLAIYGTLQVALTLASIKADTGKSESSHRVVDPAVPLLGSLLFVATVTVSAVDRARFHWSSALPESARIAGLAALALSGSLQVWAMAVNPFFSPNLCIQIDHRLVARGPYRLVRHPGYLAMLVSMPATALALGSLAGLLPALGYELLILSRAMREDGFLRNRLGGYAEYARTVHCRIVPGLW